MTAPPRRWSARICLLAAFGAALGWWSDAEAQASDDKGAPSLAEPAPTPSLLSDATLCHAIDNLAVENALPPAFFTRVIWQESRFDPQARSPAGAVGIAQFMPYTAAERGLVNPFEPITALKESAAYLSELRYTFGNLGLAAAAYNAGPYRVTRWLRGETFLPDETQGYVRSVTGRSAGDWRGPDAGKLESAGFPPEIGCSQITQLLRLAALPQSEPPPSISGWKPWGVQLAGAWTQGPVLAAFERLRRRYVDIFTDREPLVLHIRTAFAPALRYMLQIGEDSPIEANRFCNRLKAAGGVCDVVRNIRR
jgi:hypothetical protein